MFFFIMAGETIFNLTYAKIKSSFHYGDRKGWSIMLITLYIMSRVFVFTVLHAVVFSLKVLIVMN